MNVGDLVAYFSSAKDGTPSFVGKIGALYPRGIDSCRMPMLKIEGRAGLVLESHCFRAAQGDLDRWLKSRETAA